MKTAISLPDDTYLRATAAAARLGVSRSALFVQAMEQYLDRSSESEVTASIDAALASESEDDSNRFAAALGAASIMASTELEEW